MDQIQSSFVIYHPYYKVRKIFPDSTSSLSLSGHLHLIKQLQCGKMFGYLNIILLNFIIYFPIQIRGSNFLFGASSSEFGLTMMLKCFIKHLLALHCAWASSKKPKQIGLYIWMKQICHANDSFHAPHNFHRNRYLQSREQSHQI